MFAQTALLALAATASAHIIMQSPAPFDWEDAGTKQFPLSPEQFPCKQPSGTYKATQMNQWNAGETKGVKLIGGATHGGGSCQFSLTTDAKPNKDSQWKVIHSVIGSCTGGPIDGNLGTTATDDGIPEIPVTMPKDLPSGTYTFAWTWLNKIGNREFYMNCAPIQVEGSSGDVSSVLGSLPDMFTVNLPDTQCSTTEGQDFNYPDPGKSVVKAPTAVPGNDITGPACDTMTKMGAGKGSLGSPSQGTPSTPEAPETSEAPETPEAPDAPDAPAPTPAPAGPDDGLTGPSEPSAPSSPPSTPDTPPSTPAEGPAGCTPCTNDGAVVCIGTNQYGLCNRGCAIPQPLAAGMACTNGALAAAVKRRHIHFPRAHLQRLAH